VRIEVYFTPNALAPNEFAGRTVAVVDLLRASTTIAVALAAGAKAILPAASTEEALRIAQNLGPCLGEGDRIPPSQHGQGAQGLQPTNPA